MTNSYDLKKIQDQDQNSSKIELYVMNPCLSAFGSFEFSLLLCDSIDVANATIMRSFADSEENRTDEDREYHEEYGDDCTEGATSHPIL